MPSAISPQHTQRPVQAQAQPPPDLTIPTETANVTSSPSDGPSNRVDLINSEHGRILCIADIRGRLSQINELAKEFNATAVIHSGDFGFYEPTSLERISDRTLRHLIQYSSLISPQFRSQLLAPHMNVHSIRQMILSPPPSSRTVDQSSPPAFPLSEFPDLLSGKLEFVVPVYTVWGACEDVAILEKIRAAGPSNIHLPNSHSKIPDMKSSLSHYSITNLTVLDEATTRCLVIGGVRLRLFGLGGAIVPHKLFDNGEGGATIAGGQGTMWTSVLQVGEVVDTAQRVYDPTETRLLVSHASQGREGLLAQLALVLKADLTISAGLHFRYGVSYNEFSVQHDPESFRAKLHHAKATFNEIWDTVKGQVEAVVDEHQRQLLSNALAVANRVPAPAPSGGGAAIEEPAWKNSWNWNLPDAAFGSLILDIKEGRIGAEMRSQGFNFAYRATSQSRPPATATTASESTSPLANNVNLSLTNSNSGPNTASAPALATHPSGQVHPTKPEPAAQDARNIPPVNTASNQAGPMRPTSGGSHHSGFNAPVKSYPSYGSGWNSNPPSGPRSSQHNSQPHRYSKSRDDKRDDGWNRDSPRTPSLSPAAPPGNASLNAPHAKVNQSPNVEGAAKPNSSPSFSPKVGTPPITANTKDDPWGSSSTPPAASQLAPSRKGSFANKKKKGSLSASVKSDGAEKSDGHASGNATTGDLSPRDLKDAGNRPADTSSSAKPANGHQPEPRQNPSDSSGGPQIKSNNVDTHQNGPNNFNGQGHQFKHRGGPRGRGGQNAYNPRNGRGGRGGGGGGRGGGEMRPAGPGLVGPALAGAGIANKNANNAASSSA